MCMPKYNLTEGTTSIKYESLSKMSERTILLKLGEFKLQRNKNHPSSMAPVIRQQKRTNAATLTINLSTFRDYLLFDWTRSHCR